jgi:hypothetical protein
MAHAYSCDIAERDYSIASTQLELANARRHIKVLEVQQSALSDDVETARTEYEVLVAQLAEEQSSSDAFKRQLSSMHEALETAAGGLSEADAEIARLTEQAAAADKRAKAALQAGEEGAAAALAQAEARLAAAPRREASLEQRMVNEREAKEALNAEFIRERAATSQAADAAAVSAAAARAADAASAAQQQQQAETRLAESAGEAAALRRELAEQRGSAHELQRLLAERDGAVAVLKRQLADAEGQAAAAEGKYRSGHEGTEPELRGRLQEVERRAGEMARELGSKGAALGAMERQLGERTVEVTAEREKAEEARMRVRELEGDLRVVKTQAALTNSRFEAHNAAARGGVRVGGDGAPHNRRMTAAPAQTAEAFITQRKGTKTNAVKAGTPAKAAKAAPVEAESTDSEDVGGGTPGSVLTEDAAKATVVNVLDHLSLSGYVSPLRKSTAADGGSRAHPGKVGSGKVTKKRVAAALDDDDDDAGEEEEEEEKEEEEIAVAKPKKRGRPAKVAAKAGVVAKEAAAPRTVAKKKAAVTIDIGASFDPSGVDNEDDDDDAQRPAVAKKSYAAAPKTAAKLSEPAATKIPKATARAPAVIGGLRMPLAAIQDPKRAGAAGGAGAPGGGKKKRRLLNHGAVPGSDTLPASLLFGLGDGFKVPKLKH